MRRMKSNHTPPHGRRECFRGSSRNSFRLSSSSFLLSAKEGGRKGGMEGGREGGRKGGREGGRRKR